MQILAFVQSTEIRRDFSSFEIFLLAVFAVATFVSTARHVQFDDNTNFTDLKNLLKAHEKERMRNEASTYDKRYFAPLTPYENFKWKSSHME